VGDGTTPTGTVTFFYGPTFGTTSQLRGPVTLSGGIATMTIGPLPEGNDRIIAYYSGDANYAPNETAPEDQMVGFERTGSTMTLATSANPSTLGSSVTFTAAVRANGSTLKGTATFYDGATALGSAPLSGAGI